MPCALEPHRRAGTGQLWPKMAEKRSKCRDSRYAAGVAKTFRRHCRKLLCALIHFTHRPWERAMNYSITHRTLYEYAAPVTVSHHVTRLEPRTSKTQQCERFSLKVFPEPTLRKTR